MNNNDDNNNDNNNNDNDNDNDSDSDSDNNNNDSDTTTILILIMISSGKSEKQNWMSVERESNLFSRVITYIIPHLQKLLASDWLFNCVFFFNTRAIN